MNGIDVLVIVVGLLLLLAGERLHAWHRRIEYRRMERLVHRNLFRISGGQS
jgi:hypothetical protein